MTVATPSASSPREPTPPVPSTWPPADRRREQPRSRLRITVPAASAASGSVTPQPPPGALSLFPPADTDVPPGARRPPEPAATPTAEAGPATHTIVDLRAPVRNGNSDDDAGTRFGLGRRWGVAWDQAAQGWIGKNTPHPVWRPIVATTGSLPQWEIDTYLGVVTAEVAVEAAGGDTRLLGETLARARRVGIDGLTDEAVERGGHAVLGVTLSYTPVGGRLLLTITGTAVTLREKT